MPQDAIHLSNVAAVAKKKTFKQKKAEEENDNITVVVVSRPILSVSASSGDIRKYGK